jgi:hypothetical protein
MKLTEILNDAKAQRTLAPFDTATIKALEAMITEKNGKQYINCQVRNKDMRVMRSNL